MANRKLSEHTAITGANVNPNADYIEILDVSDTTDAASGTNKKILPSQLLIAIGAEPAKGADDNYVTDAEKVVIGNTSGTNTGDNAVNSTYASAKTKTDFITITQNVDLDTIETNSNASKVKTDLITVTQPVDLDAIETRVNDLDASVILKGGWDASAGTFPASGTAQAGWSYIVTVAGTVDGISFALNDRIVAVLDNASTSTYASNWLKLDYTDQVLSVNGSTGVIVLSTADIADSADKRYVTDAQETKIDNSATVTGTETLTNKRLTARVQSVTSSATVTPNSDTDDLVIITAQAASLIIANPTGTPTEGQALLIRIKDNGTARAVSFGSEYRAIGITLPTTTVLSKTMYLGCVRNVADTKWDVIGLSQEA